MKRYLISEVVTVQPMSYNEAHSQNDKIGTLVKEETCDAPGFAICHTQPLQLEWVPEYAFHGIPFDNDLDILKYYSSVLEQLTEHMKKYSKSATDEQRNVIYTINRHLKSINWNFKRLLNQ